MQTVADIIDRLTRFERSPRLRTRAFRHPKHNADLCPRMQHQVEVILRGFGKHRSVVYDTQGVRDDGADVVLGYRESEQDRRHICFQLKSFDDLEGHRWLNTLKAQRDDAMTRVRDLEHLYIVLCTDQTVHRDKIRQVSATYRDAPKTTVIEAQYAWTLLTLPEYRLDVHVTRMLDADDTVIRDAVAALEVTSPTAKILAIQAVVEVLFSYPNRVTVEKLQHIPHLRRLYADVLEALRTQLAGEPEQYDDSDADLVNLVSSNVDDTLASDLIVITQTLFSLDERTGTLAPEVAQLMPVFAIATDAIARYGLTREQVVPYMAELLDVPAPLAPSEWEIGG